jgi:mannose-1-phosphate guanylyltransferase
LGKHKRKLQNKNTIILQHKMNSNYLVIMAGGVGTRFWPISRQQKPKQFLDILGTGKSLLQQTVERFNGLIDPKNIIIVTSQEYVELVIEQLPTLKPENILSEPARKNTAPCIAYACYKIASKDPNANIVVSPADHLVLKEDAFRQCVATAIERASTSESLITLGIAPTRPDTGYGYIQYKNSDQKTQEVVRFCEKPNLETAEAFLASGEYLWNGGYFIWNLTTFKKSLEQYQPQLAQLFQEGNNHYFSPQEQTFIAENYPKCESISIDYALMEKATNVEVVLANVGWSDLGTWKSMYENGEKDSKHNILFGNIKQFDSKNCIIHIEENTFASVQGLDGYVVALNKNALLICKIDQEQRVKDFVEFARLNNKE